MRKYIISALFSVSVFVLVSVFPSVASAQVGDVDPNATSTPADTQCLNLTANMRYGSTDITTDGQVSELQGFLNDNGYLKISPSGYFGRLTFSAVKSYQASNGLISTGYVGPMTRARINAVSCSGGTLGDPIPVTPITSSTPSIRVTSPNGGETKNPENLRITWVSSNMSGNVTIYLKSVDGTLCNMGTLPVSRGSNISAVDFGTNCLGTSRTITPGQYKILLVTDTPSGIVNDMAGIKDESDGYFNLVSGNASTPTSDATVYTRLLSETADRAGHWYQFSGNGTNDWVWSMALTLNSPKTIKAITIIHNVPGEGWSTGSGQSALGKILYPLVVVNGAGVQLNTAYDQKYSPDTNAPAYGDFSFPAGSYRFKLYGDQGAPFGGGTIKVEFTDGTAAEGSIAVDAGITPTVSPSSVVPTISSVSPSSAIFGQTVTLTGSGFSGHDTILYLVNGSDKAILGGGMPTSDSSMNFNVAAQLCRQYGGGSGLPCKSYMTVTPGTYQIYVVSNSGQSNTVNFTVLGPSAPVSSIPQSVNVSPATVASGNVSKISFTIPANTARATLYLACPSSVRTGPESACNMTMPITTDSVSFYFYNDSSVTQNVVPNFYIYTNDNPNYAHGVTSQISVLPSVTVPAPTPVPLRTPQPTTPPADTVVSSTQDTGDSYTLALTSTSDDKAGTWGTFGLGVGNINKNPSDWGWTLNMTLSKVKTINSIRIDHGGEWWSTNNSSGYPLVVLENGNQLNTAYGNTFVMSAGRHTLNLYGQKESTNYLGVRATITFSDGTSATVSAPVAAAQSSQFSASANTGFMSAVKSFLSSF